MCRAAPRSSMIERDSEMYAPRCAEMYRDVPRSVSQAMTKLSTLPSKCFTFADYFYLNTPSSFGHPLFFNNTRFLYFPGHFRCSSVLKNQDVYIFQLALMYCSVALFTARKAKNTHYGQLQAVHIVARLRQPDRPALSAAVGRQAHRRGSLTRCGVGRNSME